MSESGGSVASRSFAAPGIAPSTSITCDDASRSSATAGAVGAGNDVPGTRTSGPSKRGCNAQWRPSRLVTSGVPTWTAAGACASAPVAANAATSRANPRSRTTRLPGYAGFAG